MKDILMTAYVLIWPAIVLLMMFYIGRGVYRDVRRAKRRGEEVVGPQPVAGKKLLALSERP